MAPFAYRIVTEWSEEDQLFLARIPALPGCVAHGDTPEEATAEARVAGEGILELMQEDGRTLPEPDAAADFSGQTRLRMTPSMHRRLAQMAAADNTSLNSMLVELIAESLGRRTGSFGSEWKTLTPGDVVPKGSAVRAHDGEAQYKALPGHGRAQGMSGAKSRFKASPVGVRSSRSAKAKAKPAKGKSSNSGTGRHD